MMLTAQHSTAAAAKPSAGRRGRLAHSAMPAPQRQRKQRLLRREGKRQPGAGHLLGIQRVDKEEYGQPPLCPAGEKSAAYRACFGAASWAQPPFLLRYAHRGRQYAPIRRTGYKPYHIGIRKIPQGYVLFGIKTCFPLCRTRARDKISLLLSISVHQCFSGRNRFGKQCFFTVWQPCV